MRGGLLLRILAVSLIVSFLLELLILLGIRHLNESGEGPLRKPALHLLDRFLEKGSNDAGSLKQFDAMRHTLGLPIFPVWIVDQQGTILESLPAGRPLPVPFRDLPKPSRPHVLSAHYRFLRLFPDLTVLRMDRPHPTFLVMASTPSGGHASRHAALLLVPFASMAASAFTGLLLTFLYLRQKSREAKTVISSLTRGELKSRFRITRLDEIGNLMMDFNRMAEAVEDLVTRIKENERSRKELLTELGHDLRTPMTGLRTAADTLAAHGADMSDDDRKRFAAIIQTESQYFLRMIDDLFFIAELDAPRYRPETGEVDLVPLLEEERASCGKFRAGKPPIECRLTIDSPRLPIPGNPHLLRRLFRNAFQNACRFALHQVDVTAGRVETGGCPIVRIRIADDGPGISPDEIARFGSRRTRRQLTGEDLSDASVSLGLGSAIMHSVVRLHGGSLKIENLSDQEPLHSGTALTIDLPA